MGLNVVRDFPDDTRWIAAFGVKGATDRKESVTVDVADRVHIWKNAEVYISIVGAEDPQAEADGTFGEDWLQVGILADVILYRPGTRR